MARDNKGSQFFLPLGNI